MNSTTKCARPACNCMPADGKKHCGESCADAEGLLEKTCQCQHSGCQGHKLKP
jgi:hypothetical protein